MVWFYSLCFIQVSASSAQTYDSAKSCCYMTQLPTVVGTDMMQSFCFLCLLHLHDHDNATLCCRIRTENRWWSMERPVCWISWTLQVRRSTVPWGTSTWGQERAFSVYLPSITPNPLRTFTSTGIIGSQMAWMDGWILIRCNGVLDMPVCDVKAKPEAAYWEPLLWPIMVISVWQIDEWIDGCYKDTLFFKHNMVFCVTGSRSTGWRIATVFPWCWWATRVTWAPAQWRRDRHRSWPEATECHL